MRRSFMGGAMLYFAYGSNLCEPRLRSRVSSARFVAIGWLAGHDLRFHKRGRDGSGKGDAHRTSSSQDRVWGAIAEIQPSDLGALDRIEGLGKGYERATVPVVVHNGEAVDADTYMASESFIDPTLRPFQWYLDLVVGGARARGLPRGYVDRVAAVESVVDPDPVREAAHRRPTC